ncbi:hypothetical protein J3R82DRAFT_11747 [Butyriboletus roseoflavus]|nr:hypothetical protein J3R82DRAFT_11747 [Butyriboletus roseoflavus]
MDLPRAQLTSGDNLQLQSFCFAYTLYHIERVITLLHPIPRPCRIASSSQNGGGESVISSFDILASVEIDVIFVGQTGVGKSSLINMIIDMRDGADGAAKVSNGARPCTVHTTSYSTSLGSGLRCLLWDTRGLDEAADTPERGWMTKLVDRIRQLASQQARELKETLRDRTRLAIPILVWCIDAAKIDVPIHWQQFRRVYLEYCEKRAIPVIVITQMPPNATGWEKRCNNQLRELDLEEGPNTVDIPLLRVRKYRNASSPEYCEDSKALRDLISEVTKR